LRAPTPAEKLLLSLGIDSAKEIDVEAIAWGAGAEVRFAELDSCEARIIGYGNRAIITVEERSILPRKRFSVAHELGHWKYHRGRSFVCRKDDIGNQVKGPTDPERVADSYAADLLLPSFLFVPMAAKIRKASFEAVDEIRAEFGTSRTATALRMVDLGPEPAMLVCHGAQKRRWFRRGDDVPDRWFPRDEIDAESSAMDVLHGRCERTPRTLIGADAWFDRRDAEQYEVFEQTVRMATGDALTLLTFKSLDMLA
jgi:hypothetical protein